MTIDNTLSTSISENYVFSTIRYLLQPRLLLKGIDKMIPTYCGFKSIMSQGEPPLNPTLNIKKVIKSLTCYYTMSILQTGVEDMINMLQQEEKPTCHSKYVCNEYELQYGALNNILGIFGYNSSAYCYPTKTEEICE